MTEAWTPNPDFLSTFEQHRKLSIVQQALERSERIEKAVIALLAVVDRGSLAIPTVTDGGVSSSGVSIHAELQALRNLVEVQ